MTFRRNNILVKKKRWKKRRWKEARREDIKEGIEAKEEGCEVEEEKQTD